jgi:hypothetical protein
MTKLLQSLTQMYAVPCPKVVRARALREAELALMDAEANAEYYAAHTAMLRARVRRLKKGELP